MAVAVAAVAEVATAEAAAAAATRAAVVALADLIVAVCGEAHTLTRAPRLTTLVAYILVMVVHHHHELLDACPEARAPDPS